MSFSSVIHVLATLLHGVDAAIFLLCALVFVCDWIRRRCYVPAYIHVMAAVTFVGTWVLLRLMFYCYPPETPPSKWEYAGLALLLAIVVYVVFVLYGGAGAAWDAKQDREQSAPENAKLSQAALQQIARDEIWSRCRKRLRLGGLTLLLFVLAFVNASLFGFSFYGFAPLWGALLAGVLFWTGATALFLFSQDFGPVDLVWKHLVLLVLLLALLYEK